ncbi:MAG: PKD-like domain-containing protein, partial [bacterium]
TDGVNGNIIPAGTKYTWSAPTGSGFAGGATNTVAVDAITGTLSATSNFIATATYVVQPTVDACSVGGTFTIVVSVTPYPNVNPMSTTICGGLQFTVTPQNPTNGLVPSGTQYTWSSPSVTSASLTGGSTETTKRNNIFGTLTNQTNTPQTAVYTVTSYLNACVGNVFSVTVNVNPRPILQNVVTTVCTDATFTVSPTTTAVNNIAPLGTTYSWGLPQLSGSLTGGESASGQSFISGTLTNPTNAVLTAAYMVTPVGPAEYGACVGNPFTITVNVNPRPVVAGIFQTVCSGVTFVISPTNGNGNVVPLNTTYTWTTTPVVSNVSLTGGGTGANVSFVTGTLFNGTPVAQTATYTVTPSFSGCAGSAFQVTVTVNPAATIAAMSTTTCSGTQFRV